MIDTHCHIQVHDFDADRDAVLAEARDAGVTALVVPAIDEPSFDATLAAATNETLPVYAAIGVHPHHAAEVTDATLARVEELTGADRVVAVGEIGLDYHYDFAPRDVQQRVFRDQVRIARLAGRPVIVHNRESDADVLRILEEEQDGSLRGVFHCFSGDAPTLDRALALDFHVSFTANITFKSSTLGAVVTKTPLERLMLETDSPWMSPPPWRGTRNVPSRVRQVATRVADLKGCSMRDVVDATSATARKFFGLLMLLLSLLLGGRAAAQSRPTVPPRDTVQAQPAVPRDSVRDWYRMFGAGGGLGTAAVQLQQGGTGEANLLTYAIQALYMPWEIFGVELRYYHFVDDKYGPNVRALDTITMTPSPVLYDHYNGFDLTARFLFNPHNPVGITGLLGVSFTNLTQEYNHTDANLFGLIVGLHAALFLNTGYGVVSPFAEYRVMKEVGVSGTATGGVRGSDIVPISSLGVMYFFPRGFRY